MNKYLLFQLILVGSSAGLLAAASSDTAFFRGTRSNNRRHLLQESECDLFRKCMQYPPTEEHPNGHSKDSWVCELSKDDTRSLGVHFVEIVESPSVASVLANATSGKSSLVMSEAIVDGDSEYSPRMFVPENAQVEVRGKRPVVDGSSRAAANSNSIYEGPPTIGTLKTLVIRLTDKRNVAVDATVSKLKNDIFDDDVSLKTQTEACSYGKLKIEPFKGNTPSNKYISNGIVDVKMDDYDMKAGGDATNAAFEAANDVVGDLSNPMFDLVMFCYPPGDNSFIAYAYPNHKYTFYNNQWCGFVSAQMHEVGHNLGLAHSGVVGSEYGDVTGFMGFSSSLDDQRKCFNPQKNFQLKWYEDKVETIDPLDLSGGQQEFVLNGISDYDKTDALVVLRLEQSYRVEDYYIGYNRAVGVNEDSSDDRDRVTIIRKDSGDPYEYGLSTKVKSLMPGQSHVIENYNGKNGRDVQIIFLARQDNGDARILVKDSDEPMPNPTGNCQKFTIELTTDNYPGDNSWYVVDKESGAASLGAVSPVYELKKTKHVQEICLPMGEEPKTYQFSIIDSYGDGVCCSQGPGSYRALDETGNVVFTGDNGSFTVREHLLEVSADPDTTGDPPPDEDSDEDEDEDDNDNDNDNNNDNDKPPCKNENKGVKFKLREDSKEKSCKKWADKGKCDKKIKTGPDKLRFVWEVCEKSCDRCNGNNDSSSE